MTNPIVTIPARRGKACRLPKGKSIKVINTHGSQVVDTWAFNAEDLKEFMSMEHTRAFMLKLSPEVGDRFLTNKRRPIITVVEDTSPGIHDTLLAACDDYRYRLIGCNEYHDNCTDNLFAGMKELGLDAPEVPSPLNLFMNIPWSKAGTLSFEAPYTRPGDYIVLRAEMDVIMAFSACPQDMLPINGKNRKPTEAHFQVL